LKFVFTARALLLATALPVLAAAVAHAGEVVYRWKDAEGNQVNSDRPPPEGIKYETISTSSSMVHTVDPEGSAAPSTAKPAAGKEASTTTVAKAPAPQKNPEYCELGRNNLAQLDTHARIQMRNEKGEVYFLNEEEKAVERKKAMDTIKAYCE
jgi:hypothetical protein